jgi:hypothetical protein
MSWLDEIGAEDNRKFVGGLANAYEAGYDPRGFENRRRYEAELAMRQQQHDADLKERGLRTRGLERVDQATQALTDAQTSGISRNTGLGMATEPEYDASMVVRRPASERELLGLQSNLAAARGDIGGLQTITAQGKAVDRKERLKATFGKYGKLKDEELLQVPELRALLNDNPKIRGAVGYDPKTKKYVVSDYQGSGQAESMSRAELMDAAMQLFEESEGEVDQSIARGLARGERGRTRGRQDMADQNTGLSTAHRMNVDESRLGIDRERLGIDRARHAREKAADKRLDEGLKLGQEAEGYAQGYIRAKGLGPEGEVAAKIYDEAYRGAGVRGAGFGVKLPSLQQKPPFDPKAYAETVSKFVEAGVPRGQAFMRADQMYGQADPNTAVVEALKRAQDAKRGQSNGAVKEAPRGAAPAGPPQGNLGMFEAMDDQQLGYYARAGNQLAQYVAQQRARQPVDTQGYSPY